MKKQQGFTIIELMVVLVFVFGIGVWGVNGYKLTQCDFEAPYKCEAIHGAGLLGPFSIITVWFGTDS